MTMAAFVHPKGLMRRIGLVFAGLVAVLGLSASVQAQTLPDSWQSFVRQRGGAVWVISCRAEVAGALAKSSAQALVFTLDLQSQGEAGLPDAAENDRLSGLDALFDGIEAATGAASLGRATGQGQRQYLYLTGAAEDLGAKLQAAAGGLGYTGRVAVEPKALEAYERLLQPTPEEVRGIQDQGVLDRLAQAGDVAEKVRQVDHWAYFPTQALAEQFAEWAGRNGFRQVDVSTAAGALPWQVRSSHDGTMIPDDIRQKTMAQFLKAQDLGGAYDGWETAVMR